MTTETKPRTLEEIKRSLSHLGLDEFIEGQVIDLLDEAASRASPEEGRLREALEEMAAQHRCGCGHPACLHDTKEMP